jgi:hypothetical protein
MAFSISVCSEEDAPNEPIFNSLICDPSRFFTLTTFFQYV